MKHTRFVGLDVHKDQISVAVAESGRGGAAKIVIRSRWRRSPPTSALSNRALGAECVRLR